MHFDLQKLLTPGGIAQAVFVIAALTLFVKSFYVVRERRFKVIERFGKFLVIAKAGLRFKVPFIDRIAYDFTYRIQERVVKVETITSDKVTVTIEVPVQAYVIVGQEEDAAYSLTNVWERVDSLVFDEVRARVPQLSLDQLFQSKDETATFLKDQLSADLGVFGYAINRVMITDIEPNEKVKAAMNDINASLKEGEAALARAENEQKVQIAQAAGRLNAAKLNKEAEIIDAEAVAASITIIGKMLHENEGYLRWKWIEMMDNRDAGDTIYVPTEASLPILEATRNKMSSNGQVARPQTESVA